MAQRIGKNDIAIIGLSGRFPRANNVEEFWENLRDGVDCISEIPKDRWDSERFFSDSSDKGNSTYSKWGGFIKDAYDFDPAFFNISPKEAALLDPQQRKVLEVAYEAIESAGYSEKELSGSNTGVFLGLMGRGFFDRELSEGSTLKAHLFTSSLLGFTANRVSFHFNLTGPSLVVDTLCSSSLVALELGCKSIRDKECRLALVGAAYIHFSPQHYVLLSQLKVLSKKGRCQTFDENADGIVSGEGVGLLLLKALDRAVEDGDHVHAVIKGLFVNSDGRSSRFTATSPEAQEQMLLEVLERSQVNPESITYVETHGTGTRLGDPIELMALNNAYGKLTNRKAYCALGSVKSNIGHLEPACGIAGLIKVVLAMKHRLIPPTIHFQQMNHYINMVNSPFIINDKLIPWQAEGPLRAGVSAFGMGGTNVHVILEASSFISRKTRQCAFSDHIFTLSARSAAALKNYIARFIDFLTEHPAVDIHHLCYTTNRNRGSFALRLAVLCTGIADLKEKLERAAGLNKEIIEKEAAVFYNHCRPDKREVFILLDDDIDEIEVRLSPELAAAHAVLSPGAAGVKELPIKRLELNKEAYPGRDGEIRVPVNRLLASGGFKDFLTLPVQLYIEGVTVHLHRLYPEEMRQTIPLPTYPFEQKRYMAAEEPADRPHPLLHKELSRSYNQFIYQTAYTRDLDTLFGDHRVLNEVVLPGAAVIEWARASGHHSLKKPVTVLQDLTLFSPLKMRPGRVIHSRLEQAEAGIQFMLVSADPEHADQWQLHARCRLTVAELAAPPNRDLNAFRSKCPHPVDRSEFYRYFASSGVQYGPRFQLLDELYVGGDEAFAAIRLPAELKNDDIANYPMHPALVDAAIQAAIVFLLESKPGRNQPYLPFNFKAVRLYRPVQADCFCLLKRIDQAAGVIKVDISLLDRQGQSLIEIEQLTLKQVRLRKLDEWFYHPRWQPMALPDGEPPEADGSYLVFSNADEFSFYLLGEMKKRGWPVIRIEKGEKFFVKEKHYYTIDPLHPAYFERIAQAVVRAEERLAGIIFLWPIDRSIPQDVEARLYHGLYSLFFFIQSLAAEKINSPLQLLILTGSAQAVTGDEDDLNPAESTLWGFSQVLPLEFPHIRSCCLDVAADDMGPESLSERIFLELDNGLPASRVAYRGEQRYVWELSPLPLPAVESREGFAADKVYLISGGFGGFGLELARYLAGQVKARVVLISRSPLAGRSDQVKKTVEELKRLPTPVDYYIGDVCDRRQMEQTLALIKEKYHRIDGVFHAAGVLKDGLIKDKSFADFQAVLQPKIQGALVLNELLKGENPDFFVLFSSIIALVGNIGQADYAAANSFLDCFAARQRKQGTAGLSINWSYLQVGMGSAFARSARTKGYHPLSVQDIMASLERAVLLEQSQVMIADRVERTDRIEKPLPEKEPHYLVQVEGQSRNEVEDKEEDEDIEERAGAVCGEESLMSLVLQELAAILEYPVDALDIDASFMELGMDSILAVNFTQRLGRKVAVELDPTLVFDYPDIRSLVHFLHSRYAKELAAILPPPRSQPDNFNITPPSAAEPEAVPGPTADSDIAVIGMAGRFPGARTTAELWENICRGKSSVKPFPAERVERLPDMHRRPEYFDPHQPFWGGYMDKIEYFDPLFFEISPQEAEFMDPQQRLLLETVWEALENGGYPRGRISGSRTAVYIGACIIEYDKFIADLDPRAGTGNEMSILANRISYFLNLKGPSLTIDTACSSSLVALHMGCHSILAGMSDMALVGGVNLILTPWYSLVFEKAGMLSKTGRCHTFDQSADGYVRGEGAGVVLLKPLKQALADRDRVLAVIKGSAVNQDGRSNGLTAPNALAQEEVMLEAWERAGIDPRTISLVEAHGTGTSLGDPIEVNGLSRAFGRFSQDRQFCAIGSIKSNIGHLEASAGISGLIKLIEALLHRILPPTLNFNRRNPLIDFGNSPFYVVDKPRDWQTTGCPRRAVISSFGFGGTNAHVILEESPVTNREKAADRQPQLIVLSARTPSALAQKTGQLSGHLDGREDLAAVAHTLGVGRDHFNHRLAFVAQTIDDIKDILNRFLSGDTGNDPRVHNRELKKNRKTKTVFLFGDDGGQLPVKGFMLYHRYAAFRDSVDRCDAILSRHTNLSVKDIWNPGPREMKADDQFLGDRILNFVVGYALARLVMDWGIKPDLAAGRSAGLVLAACMAGDLTLDDALGLVIAGGGEEAYRRAIRSVSLKIPVLDLSSDSLNFDALIDKSAALFLQIGQLDHALKKVIEANNQNRGSSLPYIPLFKREYDEYFSLLQALAEIYVWGGPIDWDSLNRGTEAAVVPLPTYPFEQKPYWQRRPSAPVIQPRQHVRFWGQQWKPIEAARPLAPDRPGTWLIFADRQGVCDRLLDLLKDADRRVVVVKPGSRFEVEDTDHYRLDRRRFQDYVDLFDRLKQSHPSLDRIVFAWSLEEPADLVAKPELLDDRLETGMYALFFISKVLAEMEISPPLHLLTVSYCGHRLQAEIPVTLDHALIPIYTRTIPHENRGVLARHLHCLPGEMTPRQVAETILTEANEESPVDEIFYFRGERLARHSIPFEPESPPSPHPFAQDDVIVVFGGGTGVGFEVARYLARTRGVRLVLVGRTTIPPRSEWTGREGRSWDNGRVGEIVRNIEALEAAGAEVEYMSGDIADYARISQIVSRIKAQWGTIKGVIHCAGVIDSQLISIRAKTLASFQDVLRPKVHGSLVLARVVRQEAIPYVILFSSLSSLSGELGRGFSDYAAANSFLDALAGYFSTDPRIRCISINWPVWIGVGMSNRGISTQKGRALTAEEALRTLDRILQGHPGYHISVVSADSQELAAYTRPRPKVEVEGVADIPPENEGKLEYLRDLKEMVGRICKIPVVEIDGDTNFSEYGMDSISIADLMGAVEARFHRHFDPSIILKYPDIRSLARFLSSNLDAVQDFPPPRRDRAEVKPHVDEKMPEVAGNSDGKIAVVGLACRFPRADNPEVFWKNLCAGLDCITQIPPDRWDLQGFYSVDPGEKNKSFCKWGGFIADHLAFDPRFFDFSEEDVLAMDPQHLLSLEMAWEAFENAGYGNIKTTNRQVGVFWGARGSGRNVAELSDRQVEGVEDRNEIIGTAQNMIAARISDFFNLQGPSMVVDTACSSSLVSLHLACQSILSGECDMALAGGVDLLLDPRSYIRLSQAQAISPQGKCFTFDKRANGYVPGEGAGALILKPLAEAIGNQDTVYAVILGSAVNNDGRTMGITTPNLEGQKAVIKKAIGRTGVDPRTVSYIEAHGTGTTIGDPIEIKALTEVFREHTDRRGFCGLGSVKTNIGHLHCAAGIAGLIKLTLSLFNKKIPPSLNCDEPNPRFDLLESPFFPVVHFTDWQPLMGLRRGAISSFGFGGTNCHVIMEEYADRPQAANPAVNSRHLFTLSARSETALKQLINRYGDALSLDGSRRIADVCYSVKMGRQVFPHRFWASVKDTGDLLAELQAAARRDERRVDHPALPKLVFMFTGQGALYPGIGGELIDRLAVFRRELEKCDRILRQYLPRSIFDYLSPTSSVDELKQTSISQPVTFAVDYALAQFWLACGLKPSAVCGHSLGEFVAACLAGVFSLADALKIVTRRGQLMQQLPPDGAMAVIFSHLEQVQKWLTALFGKGTKPLSVAAVNSPNNIVVSGEKEALETLLNKVKEEEVKFTRLVVSHAFHSHLMEPIVDDFGSALKDISLNRPRIPLMSNVTGTFVDREMEDVRYWTDQILKPVQFHQGILGLAQSGVDVFLEVGPGTTLCTMAKDILPDREGVVIASSLKRTEPDWEHLLETTGRLFQANCTIDFQYFGERGRRIPLPTYPFERKNYGPKVTRESAGIVDSPMIDGVLQRQRERHTYFKVFHPRQDWLLRDHRLYDRFVLPAVSQWEMGLAAYHSLAAGGKFRLKEVFHKAPIAVDGDDIQSVQVHLLPGLQRHDFKIESWDGEQGRWQENASGVIEDPGNISEAAVDIESLKQRIDTAGMAADDFYAAFEKRSLYYGPGFRAVKEIWLKGKEALGYIELPAVIAADSHRYYCHPAIMDAALQLISLLLGKAREAETFVPFFVNDVCGFGPLPARCYGLVELPADGEKAEVIHAKVKILDPSGEVKLSIDDFCLKTVKDSGAAKYRRRSSRDHLTGNFIRPLWVPSAIKEKEALVPGTLLVFSEEGNPLHRQIIEQLKAENQNPILVNPADAFQQLAPRHFTINPQSGPDYVRLVEDVSAEEIALWGIVHLWTCTEYEDRVQDLSVLLGDQERGAYSLFHTIQALHKAKRTEGMTLAVVSSYSQVVESSAVNISPEKAPLLGIIQTIPHEFGHLECSHIDVEPEGEWQGRVGGYLLDELKSTQKELFVAYRGGKRLVRRLETFDPLKDQSLLRRGFREEGVYVIIGGLGGIGLEVAKFLASRARARLALIGRTPFPPQDEWQSILQAADDERTRVLKEKIEALQDIQASGAEVVTYAADVTDLAQMEECVGQIKRHYGAIHGVFHAAGVLKDNLLINMSKEDFQQVLDPKMSGCWVLDRVLEGENLDLLVIFSGLVTYVGITGQSNHTAADYFEDVFSYYRANVKKQPTQVINWGIWGGTGVVATPFYTDTLENLGFPAIDTDKALSALEVAWQSGQIQLGIGEISRDKRRELIYRFAETDGQSPDRPFFELIEMGRKREPLLFTDEAYRRDFRFGEKLQKLCGLVVIEFFQQFNLFEGGQNKYSADAIQSLLKIKEEFLPLLHTMLKIAEEEGFVGSESARAFADRLSEEYPESQVFVKILQHCLSQYPAVLPGKLNPMQVLFSGGSAGLLRGLYRLGSPHDQLLCELLTFYLSSHFPSQTVRILEVGAGTGGLSGKVLSALKGFDIDYYYTDISPVLINEAKEAFKDHPLHYKVFDLNRSPQDQGFSNGTFHLVLGANVFHVSQDIDKTLSAVKKLMVPGGLLAMLETTMMTRFADLVFGLTRDWWRSNTTANQAQSVLMTAPEWLGRLCLAGFERAVALPLANRQTARFPFSVILAHSPAAAPETLTAAPPPQPAESAGRRIREPVIAPSDDLKEFIYRLLMDRIAAIIDRDQARIDPEAGFLDLGLDSLSLVALSSKLEQEARIKLYPTLFFEYQTVAELTDYLYRNFEGEFLQLKSTGEPVRRDHQRAGEIEVQKADEKTAAPTPPDMAVIGMAGIFPGAGDIEAFWEVLISGKDCIAELDSRRWDRTDYYDPQVGKPDKTYCKWAGLIEGIDEFDAAFFNISRREANKMDPQQRHFLETVYRALEHAGCGPDQLFRSRTGVFVGVSNHHYYDHSFDPADSFCALGGQNGMVANRISYFFNFSGPSLVIDTQCSSSLVALNYACKSIQAAECEMAVVGGVNLFIPVEYYKMLSQIRALSPDGRCKAFDRSANGFVSGEGVAAVVIKPLSDARADKNLIHAVIKSSAVNHDGRSSNLAAPNMNAQSRVVTEAIDRSRLDPETITYIEAHGTGTSLGDPVEIAALCKTFKTFTPKKSFCGLGSVKTNVGHLEAAAGLAGMIKVILAMRHRQLPPSLHFNQPNPHMDFNDTPFFINDRPIPWRAEGPLRAGISSFGMGGTNAHVVLEEPPLIEDRTAAVESTGNHRPVYLLTISAKSAASMQSNMINLYRDLERHSHRRIDDICYTFAAGRGHFAHRLAVMAETISHLKAQLSGLIDLELPQMGRPAEGIFYHYREPEEQNRPLKVLFIFPPRISIPEAYIPELLTVDIFRDVFQECETVLALPGADSLINYLRERSAGADRQDLFLSQAAAVALQYACVRLLQTWGIEPAWLLGFGPGEFAAALAAGFIGLEHAFSLMKGEIDVSDIPFHAGRVRMMAFDGQRLIEVADPGTHRWGNSAYEPGCLEPIRREMEEKEVGLGLEFDFGDSLTPGLLHPAVHAFRCPEASFWHSLLAPTAAFYVKGGKVNWQGFFKGYEGRIIELPTYAFDHKKFWFARSAAEKGGMLFEKYGIGHLEFKNRILKSAIEIGSADGSGRITDGYLDFYRRWADVELGLNVAGNFMVSADARSSDREVVISRGNPQLERLSELRQIAGANGTKFLVQLNHAGFYASPQVTGRRPIAPSEASPQQIQQVIEDFAAAADIASQAKCDGIQLHAANNFLLAQFISPHFNLRGDEWGGDPEKRLQLLLKIVEAIRRRQGDRFFIAVKMDGADQDGLSSEELIKAAERLKEAGVDLLEISRGLKGKPGSDPQFLDQCRQIKAKVDIPLAATGGMAGMAQMQEVMETGWVDMIGLGRPLVCEPDLIKKIKEGQAQSARCKFCSLCFLSLQKGGRLSCFYERPTEPQPAIHAGLFSRRWQESARPVADERCRTWAVVGNPSDLMSTLMEQLKAHQYVPLQVEFKTEFCKYDAHHYAIRPGQAEDYIKLLSAVRQDFHHPLGFIHLGGADDGPLSGLNGLEEKLARGVFSLLLLSQAVAQAGLSAPSRLVTITRNAQQVVNREPVAPENATVTALSRIIPHEVKSLSVLTIDFASGDTGYSEIAEVIVEELAGFSRPGEEIAYRQQKRLVCEIDRLSPLMDADNGKKAFIREDGFYLVTGGLSGLGAVLSNYLARQKPAGLVIVGREQLDRHHPDDQVAEKVRTMGALRDQGIEVLYYSADVSDLEAMKAVVLELEKTGKTIRGVIHCAGVLDTVNRSIRRKTVDSFRQTLIPKVHGLMVLAEIFKGKPLDFLVCCSSIAALHGKLGVGLSDYSAANFFMDQFARAHSAQNAVSINWALWAGVGHGARKDPGAHTFPLEKSMGLEAFDTILTRQIRGNIAVINPGYAHSFLQFLADETPDMPKAAVSTDNARTASGEENKAPVDTEEFELFIEKLLIQFLQLSPEEVNRNVGFNDYGMDSIIVADMVGAIEDQYQIQIHPADVLEYPTIKKLARYIAALSGPKRDNGKVDFGHEDADRDDLAAGQEKGSVYLRDILEKLSSGKFSVDEAIKQYGSRQGQA